ncbi:MAG: YlbF family regulator [Candidatus Izemoplasmatales bacterium]
MSKAEELLTLLDNSDLVCELKSLKKCLEESPNGLMMFQRILSHQKQKIHKDLTNTDGTYAEIIKEYQDKYANFQEYPLVAQYLNLTEELSILVNEIVDIIKYGIID